MNYRFYSMLCIGFLCFNSISHAKIFRIGYTGPQIAGTDYANFQTAHDAATAGDTLLYYPGSFSGNASKPLVHMGYGYFLSGEGANTGLQLITGTSALNITLDAGSSGSHFEGLGNDNGYLTVVAATGINDIVIRRCNFPLINSSTSADCSNWQVIQSSQVVIQPRGWFGTGRFLNLRVQNCDVSMLDFRSLTPGSNGEVSNCVINYEVYLIGASIYFQNNICNSASFEDVAGSLFEYNLFDFSDGNNGITGGTGNQYDVDMNNVFVGSTGNSTDGQWQLKAGSPAIGAGAGGIDCGMFAGTNPYRLSGIPSIPVFYKLTAPSHTATTNPYTITFSVKSNN